jgi:hypothetical protein
MSLEPKRLNPLANGANLFFGRVSLHHDEHGFSLKLAGSTVYCMAKQPPNRGLL